jgi:hypothetical protein
MLSHYISSMPSELDDLVGIGLKKVIIHQISYSGLGTKSGGPLGGISKDTILEKYRKLHRSKLSGANHWNYEIPLFSVLNMKQVSKMIGKEAVDSHLQIFDSRMDIS